MHFHEMQHEVAGAGRWEKATGRYIPMYGGSRSRLPVHAAGSEIPRYFGFVGIDEKLTESIGTIAQLYEHIGGAPKIHSGKAGTLIARIQDVVEEQRKQDQEEQAAIAKAAQIAQLKSEAE